jgi:hypothetical protein
MNGLPRLVQDAPRASIMDTMGPCGAEPPLCLTDKVPAVEVHVEVQVARPLTEQDIEAMRANRELVRRITRRLLRNEHIFDSAMADEAMREMRDRGEVDDETRQRIMRVKNERKRIRAYMRLLGACVERTLPVDTACAV